MGFPFTQWPQDLKDQYTYNLRRQKSFWQKLVTHWFQDRYRCGHCWWYGFTASRQSLFLGRWRWHGNPHDGFGFLGYFCTTGHKNDALAQRGVSDNSVTPTNRRDSWTASRPAIPSTGAWLAIRFMMPFIQGNGEHQRRCDETGCQGCQWICSAAALLYFSAITSLFAFYQPWFKGYYGQSAAISGTAGSPQLISFYASRFWIDSTLKKSMGK